VSVPQQAPKTAAGRVTPAVVIGRELELARLRGPVAALAAGRGRAVLVSGEPGIGKSTLLDAAATQAVAAGVEVLRSWPEQGIATCEPLAELADRAVSAHPGLRPTVVIFEDLHAADEAQLGLWRRLARAGAHVPVLLLGARRPVPPRPTVERLRRETAELGGLLITLESLTPREVAALAKVVTGAPPGPDLLDHLEAAGRNPRYVRELIDAASAAGVLHHADGLTELTEPGFPARLAGPIAQRLDFIEPQTLDVLRGAALLEAEFSVGDLGLITASTPVELLPVLDEAMAAGLIESSGQLLRLRHPVIRRGLYEATPPERRIAEHRRAAWVLTAAGAQPQRVARQLLLGAGSATEPWEADWLAEHGEELSRRDPGAASRLFERRWPASPPRTRAGTCSRTCSPRPNTACSTSSAPHSSRPRTRRAPRIRAGSGATPGCAATACCGCADSTRCCGCSTRRRPAPACRRAG
jgi:hypothetical protein